MAILRGEGIVLKTHALGDTSRIVVVFTRDRGLIKLVAKGARRSPSRFGYALEPLSRSQFTYYWKPDRDLHLVSQAETIDPIGSRLADLTRLAHGQAALELVDRVVWGPEPQPELFDLLLATVEAAASAPVAALPATTLAFELQVASLLGYRPRLDACAGCGRDISPRRLFSPARGGLICDSCAGSEAGAITLSADALAGLALLLSRPVQDAGSYLELKRAGEIQRVVEAFFRYHFQRFHSLRSLEMLRVLPAAPSPLES
jgi:DNA repair protein RecO (recombination protein O)